MPPEPKIYSDCPLLCSHVRIFCGQSLPITMDINLCSIFFEWRCSFLWLRIVLSMPHFTSLILFHPDQELKMDIGVEGKLPIAREGGTKEQLDGARSRCPSDPGLYNPFSSFLFIPVSKEAPSSFKSIFPFISPLSLSVLAC